jgi:hypothetical protein
MNKIGQYKINYNGEWVSLPLMFRGKSAYDIAKEHGYTGSEEEFASLLAGISEVENKINEIPIEKGDGNSSVVLKGFDATATDDGSISLGNQTKATNKYSHAEGYITTASGYGSHAEGFRSQAIGAFSHAEGGLVLDINDLRPGSTDNPNGNGGKAIGPGSHAEGCDTIAYGENAHAEGRTGLAYGKGSHIEGTSTDQFDPYDLENIIGEHLPTSAEAHQAIIDYWEKETLKLRAVAWGEASHAEGLNNLALGNMSHAEGRNTIAKGHRSHAEGYGTTASGEVSHAEGYESVASGARSHAGGNRGKAIGDYSFAHGNYTEAKNEAETAFGKYNQSNSDTIFSVGNGTSTKNRKNAFEIKSDNTAYVNNEKILTEQYRLEYTATQNLLSLQPCNINYSNHEYDDTTGKGVFIYNEAPTSIRNKAFYECSHLTSVTIGNSVTDISYGAFAGCSNLTSITIPNSVTSIGEGVFSRCKSLTSITIPDSVISIGKTAFNVCESLTSVTIGSGVTTIGSQAFYGCTSLKSVYCKPIIPPTLSSFPSNVDVIYVSLKSLDTYKSATNWSNYADKMVGSEILSLSDDSLMGISISLEERIKHLENIIEQIIIAN